MIVPAKPNNIDDYLAELSKDKRAAPTKLREAIQDAAPKAEECISYGLPAFRLDGRVLVCFGASKDHCSFFPGSGTTVAALQQELKSYDTSKGTIRFPVDKPLPATLVRKIVKARIAENLAREGGKERRAKPQAAGVDEFLKQLKNSQKSIVEAVRRNILAADGSIDEGIKWNSPSFHTKDYFATLNLCEGRVWLILHSGAKPKGIVMQGKIADPDGLLKWLAKDRCLITFDDVKDVAAKRTALQKVVRAWIKEL